MLISKRSYAGEEAAFVVEAKIDKADAVKYWTSN
jgi:hypothetical protein